MSAIRSCSDISPYARVNSWSGPLEIKEDPLCIPTIDYTQEMEFKQVNYGYFELIGEIVSFA